MHNSYPHIEIRPCWHQSGWYVIIIKQVSNEKNILEDWYLNKKLEWKYIAAGGSAFLLPDDLPLIGAQDTELIVKFIDCVERAGIIRYAKGKDPKEEAGVKAHLEDMRKIAFQLLGEIK